jgi:hypothetical protein
LKTLTAKEVNTKFCELIPADRLDLVGVKLEVEPNLLDLDLKFEEESGQPTMYLVTTNRASVPVKKIELDMTLPLRVVPDALMSVKDMLDEASDFQKFIEDAILTLVKRVVRIKIEPRVPMEIQDDLEITVSISGFESRAVCPLSDLAGLINQEEFETITE